MATKVMVVDDSMIMRTLVGDTIKTDTDLVLVGEAMDGEQALEKAKVLKPDVILMDIEMPKMDGLECMKRLRLISRAKVIILSSVAQVGSPQAVQARQLGAFAVIPKPSGSISMDIRQKRGGEIITSVRAAAGLPPIVA